MTAEKGRPVEHHGDVKLYVDIGKKKQAQKQKGILDQL